jgi:hypothetical protein
MERSWSGFGGKCGAWEGPVSPRFKPVNFLCLIQSARKDFLSRLFTKNKCILFVQTGNARIPGIRALDTVCCYVHENNNLYIYMAACVLLCAG